VLNRFCKFSLSIAFTIFLTGSWVTAQEASQKVPTQTSRLNVRKIGVASMLNSKGPAAEAFAASKLGANGERSALVKMHAQTHQWGRILARRRFGSAAVPSGLPSVTPLPVIGPDQGFSGFAALTGAEQASVSGGDLEPPDQGLCTDGKFVLETINVAASIYDAASHKTLAGPVYLNNFFGVDPADFTSDPRCYYDTATQRWFVTMTDLGGPNNPATELLLAVSTSSDPIGSYISFGIDVLNDGFFGVCPCFGDQPLLGADNNGFYISTNSYGAVYFGGAQIYALSKFDLELGISPFGVHLTPLPAGGGGPYPFSLQPSISPSGHGAPQNGGTEYFVSSYDIDSLENTRVSVWAMTDTDTLDAQAGLPGFTTVSVPTEPYFLPVVASQKAGPIPYGKSVGQPEGTISPDDQRMQQVIYADGHLWSSVTTAVQVGSNVLDGAAYFVIQPSWRNGALHAAVTEQGYVATANDNLIYPAIGVSANGSGAMVFTLTGPDYFPSAAYIPITLSGGTAADGVRLAAAGSKPDDGFTCYAPFGPPGRWGDYSAAVVAHGSIWIATEYISDKKRDKYTNWGTFIGSVPLAGIQ